MFCNQCEQTANGKGCTARGACGKSPEAAAAQDALIEALRRLAGAMAETGQASDADGDLLCFGLFSTLTNVNFDASSLKALAARVLARAAGLAGRDCDAGAEAASLLAQAPSPDRFSADPDVCSAMQILLYGLKGTAAYAWHAARLGQRDSALALGMAKLLCARDGDGTARGLEDWLDLALEAGRLNLRAMELLDRGATRSFGDPVPTSVSLGHRKGPCILVSGHDLADLHELLEQTRGKGIAVYTHGEMLPAHSYPKLKAFAHLAGHYGTAWQNQRRELPGFPGPVVFTTNCIQNPSGYADRVFTCGPVQWPGVGSASGGDFSAVIAKALEMQGFAGEEAGGALLTGFGRQTLLDAAPALLDAVKAGAVKHVFLVGGCDGARQSRGYYAEFVRLAPKDSLIVTLGCGKFRFNSLDLGRLGSFPRLLDAGQCNDAYAAVALALKLADALGCTVSDLPLSLVLSWYEQKAVAILLTLLALGVKGVRLGPTLPAFASPAILGALAERFGLAPVADPEADLRACLQG